MAERKVISFYGACLARAELSLVSKRINTPFRLLEIRARFATGQQNLVALRCFTSFDVQAPATGAPSGVSILRDYGQVDYVVGEGQDVVLAHELDVHEAGSYLKVWAVNSDYYDHAVNVQMVLEIP